MKPYVERIRLVWRCREGELNFTIRLGNLIFQNGFHQVPYLMFLTLAGIISFTHPAKKAGQAQFVFPEKIFHHTTCPQLMRIKEIIM